MILTIFTIIYVSYLYFLYKKGMNFISLFWLIAYGFAFFLPVFLKQIDRFGYVIPAVSYSKLNIYYLIGLLGFIFSNILINFTKKSNINNIKFKIKYKNVYRVVKIYFFMATVLILYLGIDVITKGTSSLLHVNPIISMMLPSTIFGIIFFTGLLFIFSNNNKQKRLSILLLLFGITFGLLFTFGRRIVIFPLLSIIILYFLYKRRKPNLLVIILSLILGIFFVLPLMINIRTFGITNGFSHLINMYFNNTNQLKHYIAMSTDVSAEYSLAALIVQSQIHTSPLTLLKPILIFIPRSIWPDKPVALSEHLVADLGLSKVEAMSIPPGIIGESYTYFGIIGIIFVGVFWGLLTGYFDRSIRIGIDLKEKFINIGSIFIVCFSIQFITGAIRGDTATTIQESLYLFIPLLFIIWISKFSIRK